jgi:predicted transcriptional regulator
MPFMKDEVLAVRLDAGMSEALAEVAAEQDRSRSAIVRSLIDAYVVAARAEIEENE